MNLMVGAEGFEPPTSSL